MKYELIDYVKDSELFKNNYQDIMSNIRDFSYLDIIESLKIIFNIPNCFKVYEYWDYYHKLANDGSVWIRVCDCSTDDFIDYNVLNTLTGECMLYINKGTDCTLADVYNRARELAKRDLGNSTWWMNKCYYSDFEYLLISILEKYNSGLYIFGLVGPKNKYLMRNSIKEELKLIKYYGNNMYFPRFGIKKKVYIKDMKTVELKIRKKKEYNYGL